MTSRKEKETASHHGVGVSSREKHSPITKRSNGKSTGGTNRNDSVGLQKKFRPGDFVAEKIIKATAFVSLAFIALITIFVFREALPVFFMPEQPAGVLDVRVQEEETYGEEFLGEASRDLAAEETKKAKESPEESHDLSLSNLLSLTWQPVSSSPKYGIIPLVIGSLKVTLVAMAIAIPIAILAALFISSFAPRWAKEILKPSIEILAGFPSVVIGFFALVQLASILQSTLGYPYRLNALVGGAAMALAVIPIIFTVTEDALAAIPKHMTESSLALGATKWQTALFVTLPAATPGVFAAILLGFGRAFGETMIVLMATGNAPIVSAIIADPVRTLSATIGAEMAEVVVGDPHYHVLFLLGAILFLFTFLLNAIAEGYVRARLLKKFTGEGA